MPFQPESVNTAYPALDAYAALHRSQDLILIEPDEGFYSADLGLAHVRYCFLDAGLPPSRVDYHYLGIAVTTQEFNRLGQLAPLFADHLARWGLKSTEALATVILAKRTEVGGLILAHPESDFYLSSAWAEMPTGDHDRWSPTETKAFLLSRKPTVVRTW